MNIIFNCAECDKSIIENSKDHDECICNEDGDRWWCDMCRNCDECKKNTKWCCDDDDEDDHPQCEYCGRFSEDHTKQFICNECDVCYFCNNTGDRSVGCACCDDDDEDPDFGIGWTPGWCWNGCLWKWDGIEGKSTPPPHGPPPPDYFVNDE